MSGVLAYSYFVFVTVLFYLFVPFYCDFGIILRNTSSKMSPPDGDIPDEGNGASGGVSPQIVPEKMDLEACWRIIAQQSQMLKNQETIIQSLSEGMKELRTQVAKLTPQSPSSIDSKVGLDEVVRLMDRRGAPPPEPFEMGKGRSFRVFLDQFERYCRGKYSPSSVDRWTGELGNLLKGEIWQMYKVMGGGETSFTEMSNKLAKFCDTHTGNDQTNSLSRFTNATPESGELLHIYAYRLERLFQTAHPNTSTELSLELQSKLMETLPPKCIPEIRQQIDSLKNSLETDIIPWSRIIRILRTYSDRVGMPEFGNLSSDMTTNQRDRQNDPVWFTSTNVGGPSNGAIPKQDPPRGRKPQRDQRQSHFRTRSLSRGSRGPPRNNYVNSPMPNYGPWAQNRNYQPFPKPICEFCGLPGHEMKVCWRYQGCCLRCGSAYHYARDCPESKKYGGPQHYNNPAQYRGGHQPRFHQPGYHQPQNNAFMRARSRDRQNYLQSTPLNPNSPSWVPNSHPPAQRTPQNQNQQLVPPQSQQQSGSPNPQGNRSQSLNR